MASLGTALTYPTESDDWLRTVLIGGVLSFFGFLLVPLVPVYGYLVRVIRHTLAGDPRPPSFDDWGALFTDGVKFLVIAIAYLFVPGIVGSITIGGSIAAVATGTRGGAAIGIAGLAFGLLLTLVLALVFGYLAAAALVNFVYEERLGAAFDIGTLDGIVLSADYAVAWLLSLVVFVGAAVVSGALNLVPLLGAFVAAFVFFYAQVVAATLWADGYRAARDATVDAARARAEEPAA